MRNESGEPGEGVGVSFLYFMAVAPQFRRGHSQRLQELPGPCMPRNETMMPGLLSRR
jgi:hypothetical protein